MENCTAQICLNQTDNVCVADEIERIILANRECIEMVNHLILDLNGVKAPEMKVQENRSCMKEHIQTARKGSQELVDRLHDLILSILG